MTNGELATELATELARELVPELSTELTTREQRQLHECYAMLHELAATCAVPAVRAAARAAVAEVHAALDGQALDFEMYTHRWLADGPEEDHG